MERWKIDYSDDSGMWEAVLDDQPGSPVIRSESREELEMFVDSMVVGAAPADGQPAGRRRPRWRGAPSG